MTTGGIYALLHGRWSGMGPCFKIVLHFFKKPWIAYTGPTNHGTVQAIFVPHFHSHFRAVHITISKNRNMHALVVLYLRYGSPIGLSLIHLNPSSAVNGNGLATYIL